MNRIELQEQVLRQTMTDTEIQAFFNYELTSDDIAFIRDSATSVLQRTPYKGFNCAAMTAMWCAIIQDHSRIPVAAIAGSLLFGDMAIFTCNSNIPSAKEAVTIKEIWDGHCWLEFGGLIADISIGRTISLESVPATFKDHWNKNIGEGKGLVCATPQDFRSLDIHYEPSYALNTEQINGLLAGIGSGESF